ncbi:tol-pal system-associated acyl-CoA thioesterase [Oxalobacter paraformigenes]|uniref:Tol-pal system-associated acyl-CoA thioesterase n=1 Tax=Oxalobacter paraformigenes TaxID=556268 RepID=C3X4H5_9BURK|nr:tol-pal system-associated acyl-CoA thioesterase [Oxalobacter paraformigenes]EEO28111.2 tol-pal system-associated acyl-CoA thioesterase [Oxalobacter paraformigenes]
MSISFSWPVRVYFEDTDAGGIVFYGNYLKFYERARTEWLRSMGIGQQFLKDEYRILFVVKNVSVDYKRSAVLDDCLQVTTGISRMKGASLEFEQAVWREDTLLSTATVKVVCVGMDNMKPAPIPGDIAARMRAGLNPE